MRGMQRRCGWGIKRVGATRKRGLHVHLREKGRVGGREEMVREFWAGLDLAQSKKGCLSLIC
jgi:hypothetical protein